MQTPRDGSLRYKFAASETGHFQGYAATFNTVDATGDLIMPGAFIKCLCDKRPGAIAMLWQHGRDNPDPVGEWLDIREDHHGLFVSGRLFLELKGAKERLLLLQRRAVDGLSIRFSIPEGGAAWDKENGVRSIKELDLWEISPVTWPANLHARIRVVKCCTPLDLSGVKGELTKALRHMQTLKRHPERVIR